MNETAQISAHALGVSLDETPDQAMHRLLQISKERLIESHQAEVSSLKKDIDGWREHASELGDKIRGQRKTNDRMWLCIFGLGLLLGYFAIRDLGCR